MQETAKADATMHGLDGRLIDPDWPPLTLDEVHQLLRHYPGLGEAKKLLTMSPRPFSAASVVATDTRNVFVKRHHISVRDAEGLREEHRFMAHLLERGAAVPRVIAISSDETAIQSGEWTYEVHETPQGSDLYEDAISWTPFRAVEHAYSAGQALAKLHVAARGYDAPARRLRPLVAGFTIFAAQDVEAAFNSYVDARPALKNYLRVRTCQEVALELLAPFHVELQRLLPLLEPLWTHNDLHSSNLMWTGEGTNARATAVIDFGLADRTNAVHDISQAIERNIVDWIGLVNDPAHPEQAVVHYDHLSALLDGYESVRTLRREERAALAPMMALCHAEFALSETDYFLDALHSEEKAWYACEGYLVLHSQWFRGAGSGLLDWLRTWAEKCSA